MFVITSATIFPFVTFNKYSLPSMNLHKNHLIYIFFIFLTGCASTYYATNTESNSQKILFKDHIYQNNIKSVVLYPFGKLSSTRTPVIPVNEPLQLQLEFDDLSDYEQQYMVKIRHLNADWSESRFPEMDYLNEYNEFRITDYAISIGNTVSYIHYKFLVPPVKVSGNYLVQVYKEGNENDVILTKQFVVFENSTRIYSPDHQTGLSSFRGHNIDFNVNYAGSSVEDPFLHLKAVIRQNNRWDNALVNIAPTQIRDDLNEARFQSFVNTQSFEPGNEFRFFDIRSVISPGQNVTHIDRETTPIEINVAIDKSRNNLAYTFTRDLNGSFLIENYDGRNPDYASHYIKTRFTLKNDELLPSDTVYVSGEFNQWTLSEENRMKLTTSGQYQTDVLLKQGFYNYIYLVKSPTKPEHFLEGSFINTENFYEIFIYDTNPVNRNQRCIGYYMFGLNERIR